YNSHSSVSLSYSHVSRSPVTRHLPLPGPCTCHQGSTILKDHLPKEQSEELKQRRAREFQLLFALPNSPLQYPIQGYTVQPLTSTVIPGILGSICRALCSGENKLIIESSNLVLLNNLLAKVSYTSTVYHINTGDLGIYISSHVTITTKTFLRYRELKVLLDSIRKFYNNIKVIIADDSLEPEPIHRENILHYLMPPAQGWFAGRNLAVSQVTTKYFLWVDDDFVFTEKTKIEKLVEVMEANPELDVVGGAVEENQFYFTLIYEEGEENEGGCLYRMSQGKFHSLPGYPQCFLANGVVNFFLARTDAVQKVGFDPKLQRVAHSEFFMDGLGSLLVASCSQVSIGHQPKTADSQSSTYDKYRIPGENDEEFKLQLHFYKNNLKCIKYG
uniref:Glycosyltransferase 2-like domain-containing protein n=1 Tax=Oreochromis aureus TaxID=47969 RepID=A0A668RBZ7_OREAU